MKFLFAVLITLIPNSSFAASGIVTCHAAGTCTFCRLLEMINTITEWLIIMGTLFAVMLIAYAGVQLIFSQGNRAVLEQAKQRFFNALIGIFIMLAAWTIVDTVIKLVAGGQLGMWNEVTCGVGEFQVGTPTEGLNIEEYSHIGLTEGQSVVLLAGSNPGFGSTGGGSGTLDVSDCDPSQFRTINFMGTSVQIHQALVPSLQRIDAAWRSRGGSRFYRVDVALGVQCRNVAGSNRRSNHAYGIAIDINPAQNPHMGVAGRPNQCVTDMPQEFVQMWLNEGWGWGCNWRSSKDAMHFSKAPGEGGDGRY